MKDLGGFIKYCCFFYSFCGSELVLRLIPITLKYRLKSIRFLTGDTLICRRRAGVANNGSNLENGSSDSERHVQYQEAVTKATKLNSITLLYLSS